MKKSLYIVIVLLLITALVALNGAFFSSMSPQDFQTCLASYGALAPLLYVLSFAILPAFFFPVAILALAAGLMFGLFWGSVLTFIGAVINCALMFWISRSIAHDRVAAFLEAKLSTRAHQILFKQKERNLFLLLVSLRLVPLVPYNLINYSMGLSRISFANYMLASIIGIIPGTLVFVNLGEKALQVGSPEFWLALALLALLVIVTGLLSKGLFPEEKDDVSVYSAE